MELALRNWPRRAADLMHFKFLARGTGSAAAREELFGGAAIERVMRRARPPAESTRTPLAESVSHDGGSAAASRARRSDVDVECRAEGKLEFRPRRGTGRRGQRPGARGTKDMN